MQADRFTVKSQEAVSSAQQLASARRNPETTPAHLLVALLVQEDGLVVPILQKLGADTATIGARAHEAVEALPTLSDSPRLAEYQPYWAARAELLSRLGQTAAAGEAYDQAIGLEADPAVRRFLQKRRTRHARSQ